MLHTVVTDMITTIAFFVIRMVVLQYFVKVLFHMNQHFSQFTQFHFTAYQFIPRV